MRRLDAIVLGAGPAGLGAGLALVRDGAAVAVLDGADEVGGLCRTRERDGLAYDLGGHILFVRDAARERWLRALLGDDLHWVPRPVACVREGAVRRGRYLDQRPAGHLGEEPPLPRADGGGAEYLADLVEPGFRDVVMRAYLEKVDRMALEDIPAPRVARLLVGQAAPDGFFYPANGIGQLMHAMAREIASNGGEIRTGARVNGIEPREGEVAVVLADGSRVTASRLIVAIAAGQAATLVRTAGAPPPAGAPRAVALVYLEVADDRLSEEPWIQCDAPDVPFARIAEPANWSPSLERPGRSVVCCECYFAPEEPGWDRPDAVLAARCAAAIVALGLAASPDALRLVEVVRLPRAYVLAPVADIAAATAPARWLLSLPGIAIAQGGAVVEAIEAGERVAAGG